jgi:hypothetical protein
VSAPAVIIRIEFEAAPRVVCDYLTEADEKRMRHWLDAHPDLVELLERAYEVQERMAA